MDSHFWSANCCNNVTIAQLAREICGHACVAYYPNLVALVLKGTDGKSLWYHCAEGINIENKVLITI